MIGRDEENIPESQSCDSHSDVSSEDWELLDGVSSSDSSSVCSDREWTFLRSEDVDTMEKLCLEHHENNETTNGSVCKSADLVSVSQCEVKLQNKDSTPECTKCDSNSTEVDSSCLNATQCEFSDIDSPESVENTKEVVGNCSQTVIEHFEHLKEGSDHKQSPHEVAEINLLDVNEAVGDPKVSVRCHIHIGGWFGCHSLNPICEFKCDMENWDCPNVPQCVVPESTMEVPASNDDDCFEVEEESCNYEYFDQCDNFQEERTCLVHINENENWGCPDTWECKFTNELRHNPTTTYEAEQDNLSDECLEQTDNCSEKSFVPSYENEDWDSPNDDNDAQHESKTTFTCHIHQRDNNIGCSSFNPHCQFYCKKEDWDSPNSQMCASPVNNSQVVIEDVNDGGGVHFETNHERLSDKNESKECSNSQDYNYNLWINKGIQKYWSLFNVQIYTEQLKEFNESNYVNPAPVLTDNENFQDALGCGSSNMVNNVNSNSLWECNWNYEFNYGTGFREIQNA